MTERASRWVRAAGGALIALVGIGSAAAQETGSAAERARQAYGTGEPAAAAARPAATEASAARAAADRLGVELISTSTLEIDGRRLVAARVMAPGGDSNVAFLVQTLVVDPASGEVLGVFPGTDDEIGALPGLAAGAPAPVLEPESGGAE